MLKEQLKTADEFKIASAFLNSHGLARIEDDLDGFLGRGGKLEIIHGADFRIADPDAFKTLVGLKDEHCPNVYYRVVPQWDLLLKQSFHPKLYISTSESQSMAIVGSSNLTGRGLEENVEINAVFVAEKTSQVIIECEGAFQELRDLGILKEPDAEWIKTYEEVFNYAKDASFSAPDQHIAERIKKLHDHIGQAPSWIPITQQDVIVQAIQNLTRHESEKYVSLKVIYEEVERIARNLEKKYVWSTLSNSVRGRLNTHLSETEPKSRLFERLDDRSGFYRLTTRGRQYRLDGPE